MVIAQLSQWRLVYQAADKLLLTAAYFLARKAFRRKLAYNPGMLFLTSGLGLCGVGFLSWLTIQETSLHALFGWSMCIILLFLIYFLLLFYSKYVEEQKRLSCAGDERADDRQGVRFDGAAREGAGGTVPRYEKSSACAFFHDW